MSLYPDGRAFYPRLAWTKRQRQRHERTNDGTGRVDLPILGYEHDRQRFLAVRNVLFSF